MSTERVFRVLCAFHFGIFSTQKTISSCFKFRKECRRRGVSFSPIFSSWPQTTLDRLSFSLFLMNSTHTSADWFDSWPGYHYGPTAQQDYSYGHYQTQPAPYHPMSTGMKSIGIKDLFDIALTSLAFLSFGMFIIQGSLVENSISFFNSSFFSHNVHHNGEG